MMSATTPDTVRPRRDGDPVPELLGLRLAHRALLRDAARLTDLFEALAAGSAPLDGARASVISAYLRDWADSVHCHHTAEDELLLPVLVASAGRHVDVSELHQDHAALSSMLDRLRQRSRSFAARPDEDTTTALAVELAELRDALQEHVGEEEALVVPMVERYVSVQDWEAVERRIRRRVKLSFELPRVRDVVTPEEWEVLAARAGRLLRLALAVLDRSHRRRERAVFGG